MTLARKFFAGVTWFVPIHRWTTAVTVLFAAGTLVWIVAIATGLTNVAKSPQDVVIDVYRAAQQRNGDDVRGFLAESARAEYDALTPEQVEALMARLSNGFTTTELEFLGVRNYGSHAVVGVMQDFIDDFSTLRVEILVKESNRWRLEWPLGEIHWAEANQRFDPYYRPAASI